jgi:hypothetical protein
MAKCVVQRIASARDHIEVAARERIFPATSSEIATESSDFERVAKQHPGPNGPRKSNAIPTAATTASGKKFRRRSPA